LILWTIQTEKAWQVLQDKGILRTKSKFVEHDRITDNGYSTRKAYQWLSSEMFHRIGPAPANIKYPLWAWYQWNWDKNIPDLRSHHLLKGEKGVRIKFEVDDDKVLLSDFDAWHFVLNYWYLPSSKKDGDSFDAELKQKPLLCFHDRIKKSWKKIFENGELRYVSGPRRKRSIQATMWELRRDQVRETKFFVGR